jgi:hypothetical protein
MTLNHPHTAGRAESPRLKPLSRYGKMVSAVRIPRDMLPLARGLQKRGHTLREIALVLDMSVEPVKRSLYDDVVAK